MLSHFMRAERVRVDDVGQIAAGSTVEFCPRGKRWITRPHKARTSDVLVSATVVGDSLIEDGVVDGDRAICRTNFDLTEIKNGRLVIVKLPDARLTIKKFFLLENGWVRLAAANRNHKDLFFALEDVEIKALVIETVRSWE